MMPRPTAGFHTGFSAVVSSLLRTQPYARIATSSLKMLKDPAVRAMVEDLGEQLLPLALNWFERMIRTTSHKPTAVMVWGRKERSLKAMDYAHQRNLPVLSLEDGFIRSLDLGVSGSPLYSVVVDDLGIYTESRSASRLEAMLQDDALFDEGLMLRAERALAHYLEARISKYNAAPELLPKWLDQAGQPVVLVIDQTVGDASIKGAQATAADFEAMLADAIARHPDALIVIKTHPDVIAKKRDGYLTRPVSGGRIMILGEDIHPPALLDKASAVYTVSSQLGFEALLRGIPVHCYGLPFYAGWGLTHDRQSCPRRTKKRTKEQLFAAAMLLYPRYYNPFTGLRTEAEAVISILGEQRRQLMMLGSSHTVCLGMSRWKRETVRDFLRTPRGKSFFTEEVEDAIRLAGRHRATVVGWASKLTPPETDRLRASGVRLLLMEDGFIRSVGLGASLTRACSLVLDDQGMYYDPSRPSRLEGLLEHAAISPLQVQQAARLRALILERNLTKYNLDKDGLDKDEPEDHLALLPPLPEGKRILLVPGQVEDDASVRLGSPEIRTNRELLLAVRNEHPDAFILYKPHPDVVAGYRQGQVRDAEQIADSVISDVSIGELYPLVDEIHTMTSLSGFEALLRGKKVHCYGLPFYAGWGLTHDRIACPRRKRRRSLDELVAAALMLYPSYVDPVTRQHCPVEVIISRLSHQPEEGRRQASPVFRLMQEASALWTRLARAGGNTGGRAA